MDTEEKRLTRTMNNRARCFQWHVNSGNTRDAPNIVDSMRTQRTDVLVFASFGLLVITCFTLASWVQISDEHKHQAVVESN